MGETTYRELVGRIFVRAAELRTAIMRKTEEQVGGALSRCLLEHAEEALGELLDETEDL